MRIQLHLSKKKDAMLLIVTLFRPFHALRDGFLPLFFDQSMMYKVCTTELENNYNRVTLKDRN